MLCRSRSGRRPKVFCSASSRQNLNESPGGLPANLYGVLGVRGNRAECSGVRHVELRQFYLDAAKKCHPDAGGEQSAFDTVARAWEILGDPYLRQIYDSAGLEGIRAVKSIDERAEAIKVAFPNGVDGEQMDFLSDTGQLAVGLLSPQAERDPAAGRSADFFDPSNVDHDDACPRSAEEAIWNITSHPDKSVRYYGLWWVYKFKVTVATDALLHVLENSDEQTALGGYGLKRRAALALGAVAPPSKKVLLALAMSLQSGDYYLRYRAAEAIANIALRAERQLVTSPGQAVSIGASSENSDERADDKVLVLPDGVLQQLVSILRKGSARLIEEAKSESGYTKQESLFQFDHLDAAVAEKLQKIFEERRANEDRSRRTTMTPQLGVDAIDMDKDEPFEWLLKALGAGLALRSLSAHHGSDILDGHQDSVHESIREVVEPFLSHPFPLVRYAAHKALFIVTQRDEHAQALVAALDYGVEHHYSQRVLIRDLGDLGYAPAAAAIAGCPMVENSFKILALKNILAKRNNDASNSDVRNVLTHMDSLL